MRRRRLGIATTVVAMVSMLVLGVAGASGYSLTADEYPAEIEAELSSPMTMTVNGAKIECGSGVYAGELTAASSEVETTPSLSECVAFGFIAVGETLNGCFYRETLIKQLSPTEYEATTEIVCPPGKEITIDAGSGICVVHIPPQKGLALVKWTLKENWFKQRWWEKDVTVTGLKTTMTKTSFLCPVTAGESTNGTITATIATHGRNSGGEPQSLDID